MLDFLKFTFESFGHFIGMLMLFGLFIWWSIAAASAFKPVNVSIQNTYGTDMEFIGPDEGPHETKTSEDEDDE